MYLVVFRNRKRADIDSDAYAADAAEMERLARVQPGFLSFKSYGAEDGEVVSISEWRDAAAAKAWGAHPRHREVQKLGRSDYYASYTAIACDNPQVRHFPVTR
ncbi:MAG TPA: antibiotic biosynthesis monooxygenase [Paracoccaceae bacterium]|nr:antibiotic biosynthesis monooxygenase [Paracoccaceae bacterium]